MELAATKLFRAKWTDAIHEEWIVNLLERRTDLTREKLNRTRDLMNIAVLDCLVVGYEDLISGLTLPDPNDRHVLAAAIRADCRSIVTFNLKDFPAEHIEKYDIEAIHPDDFIYRLFAMKPHNVIIAAQRCRARMKNPAKTGEEYLAMLQGNSLPKTVSELLPYVSVI